MLDINEFDYPLPDERIAKHPVSPRDSSKLLLYRGGTITHDTFRHLPDYLPQGTLLVYNNTRVIPARMVFHKATGARIEVFCLEPLAPNDYQLNLSATSAVTWKCLVGNLKKWKGEPLHLDVPALCDTLSAERIETSGNTHTVRFSWTNGSLSFAAILDAIGELPIPPYLNRATEESDKTDYQTVYSRIKGSVAAPTAGLHFTDEVLGALAQKGVKTTELTLHVGAGTFQPVKTQDAEQHVMHTEFIAVPRQTLLDIRDNPGHIIAVGTTSVRTLESLYYLGLRVMSDPEAQLHITQFEPYDADARRGTSTDNDTKTAIDALITYLDAHNLDTLFASTQIMIKPGFHFRIIGGMVTNFHQPKSTLLLLVSALVGDDWKNIYRYALDNGFRFLSYGDSSLLMAPQA